MKSFLLLLMLALASPASFAHKAGITDTSVQVGHSAVLLVFTVPQSLLEKAGATDEASRKSLVRQAFGIENDKQPCQLASIRQRSLEDIGSWQFGLLYQCGHEIVTLAMDYRLFSNRPRNHQNFVRLLVAGEHVGDTFDARRRHIEFPVAFMLKLWGKKLPDKDFVLKDEPRQPFFKSLRQAAGYFPLGIRHILTGADHILFLVGLLLLPLRFRELAALITAFTLAHSMTLALSVLNIVVLPARFVESMIALSIVYVAVENLWELRRYHAGEPFVTPWRRRLAIAFGFGLIHGFGFSYILREIGLGSELPAALLLFNLGVEAGQLIVVAPVFPLLHRVLGRKLEFSVARVLSVVIFFVGGFWFVERVV